MGPGLSWDAHLETWMGWYGTGMELRYNSPVDKGPGWRWDTHLETCMHLRWCLDGTKRQFGGPGWRWDSSKIQLRQRRNVNMGAWVERKHKSRDLDGVEMGPGLSWDAHLETWIGWYGTRMELRYNPPVEKWPGWKWDTILETCMGLRWCLDGTKMQFGGPGWRRDANIRSHIEVRFNWDKEETWIREPGWRGDTGWYGTRMELRSNSAVEKWPGWNWDTNHSYMLHRCHSIQWVNLTRCNWSNSKIFIEYICGKHHWFLYYTFASLNIYTSLRNPCTLNNIKQ